jgi:hypothetical protein
MQVRRLAAGLLGGAITDIHAPQDPILQRLTMAEKPKGLPYLPQLVGKHQFRIRETHVRDHLAPLLTKGRVGGH